MKSLRQSLTSNYMNAAGHLQSQHTRRKIVVYVESYEDVAFWRHILASLEDDTRYFQIMLPNALALTKGKKSAMMSALRDIQLGGNIIACVDSDYDYLLQRSTPTSRSINSNPYIFQTYVYAIENYHCYASTLHEVCTTATLNDHYFMNFEKLLARYSRIVYPLFLWNIYFYSLQREGSFSIGDFNQIIHIGRFDPFTDNPATVSNGRAMPETRHLLRLQNRVDKALQRLRRIHPRDIDKVEALGTQLQALGLTPDNTYLHIQGHHLVNQVIIPILSPICHRLRSMRETEIQENACNHTQRMNELSAYHNALTSIEHVIKANYQFSTPPALPQYTRLIQDLRRRLKQ